MENEIARALKRFAKLRTAKRGFLFLQAGAYFLYDNQFCGIDDYQMRLQSEPYHFDGRQTERSLFVGTTEERVVGAALPERPLEIDSMRLIFHIACGPSPEELLRGICLIKSGTVYLSLFSDPSIEKLFLAAEAEPAARAPNTPPDDGLIELQQNVSRNDLRLLTALYLNGQPYGDGGSLQRLLDDGEKPGAARKKP